MAEESCSFQQRIEEQLTCSVCLETYIDPRTLPCLHSFCLRCLQVLSQHNGHIRCPSCRRNISIPEGNVIHFPSAFLLNTLMAEVEQLPQPQSTPQPKVEVVDGVMIKCPTHNEQCHVYCEQCQELLCFSCAITLHKGHNYNVIETVYHAHLQEVNNNLSLLKGKVAAAKESMNKLMKVENDVKVQGKALKREIASHAEEMIALIRQCQMEKLNQLDAIVGEKVHTLSQQKTKVEETIEGLQAVHEDVEQVLQNGSSHQILSGKEAMVDLIHSVISDSVVDVKPNERADVAFIKSTSLRIGYLLFDGDISYNIQCDIPIMAGRAATVSVTLSKSQRTPAPFDFPPNFTCTLTSVSTGHTTLCDVGTKKKHTYPVFFTPTARGKHTLTITTKDINKEQVFDIPDIHPSPDMRNEPLRVFGNLHKPTGVAVSQDGVIFVVENGSNCIKVMSLETGAIGMVHRDIHVPFVNPHGIALTHDLHCVVTDDHRLQKINLDTRRVTSSVGGAKRGSEDCQLNTPMGVAIYPHTNQIFVADSGNNRVIVFHNKDLKFSHKFGSKGSNLGSFNRPTDLAFSTSGKLLVTNHWMSSIDMYTANGVAITRIGVRDNGMSVGSGELNCPMSIAIDVFENIYVTEVSSPFFSTRSFSDSRISVYCTDGCFVRNFGRKGKVEGRDLCDPCGVTFDKDGLLYVCDTGNDRLIIM